jgi:hypothetical protein
MPTWKKNLSENIVGKLYSGHSSREKVVFEILYLQGQVGFAYHFCRFSRRILCI